ncbi:MAG: hypothetical protein KC431_28670 [Myxococcales bacterium]|nr:hypothetical protein [Myxococcales bacterium]
MSRHLAVILVLLLPAACRVEEVRTPPQTDDPAAVSAPETALDVDTGPALAREGNSFVLPYGARTVYAGADPGLATEVERLFLLLEDLRAESVEISGNTELPIGWTTLTFTVEGEAGERLVVREPDYDGDPEEATRADISVSLAVLARQRAVLERVNVAGEAIDFDEHVLTIAGSLDIDEVLLLRVPSPGGRLTGWRLAPTAGIKEEDALESLPVHVILRRRPALLDAMLLPPGYIVYFAGDQMTTILDPDDVVVWDWRDGDQGSRPRSPEHPGDAPHTTPQRGPLLQPLGR